MNSADIFKKRIKSVELSNLMCNACKDPFFFFAFDMVDHVTLLSKLEAYRLDRIKAKTP